MSFKLDTSGFDAAIRAVASATGKDSVELLNKAALKTLIGAKGVQGAIQLTQKADRQKINALPDAVLRSAVIKRLRAKGELQGKTQVEIAALTKKERRRRLAAVGYTAYIGWHKAIIGVGGKGIGSKAKLGTKFDEYSAAKGYGRKAKGGVMPEAVMANTTPMSETLGERPLQQGLENAAADMMIYAQKKMQEAAKKAGL